MGETRRSVFDNLRRLTQFSGRERRSSLWPYIALVVGATVVITWVAMGCGIYIMIGQLGLQSPGPVSVQVTPDGSVSANSHPLNLLPAFATFFGLMMAALAANIGLLAAAISRRLHDRGMSGFWGLLPVPFLFIGMILMPMLFVGMLRSPDTPDLRLFFGLFLNNMFYLAALGVLVLLLVGSSSPGANRYGAEP